VPYPVVLTNEQDWEEAVDWEEERRLGLARGRRLGERELSEDWRRQWLL
jgi:hypothetical protein